MLFRGNWFHGSLAEIVVVEFGSTAKGREGARRGAKERLGDKTGMNLQKR